MSKIQDADITIMNFSGIYRYEKFYKNENVIWLDFCSLKGKNCYCDEDKEFSSSGIALY